MRGFATVCGVFVCLAGAVWAEVTVYPQESPGVLRRYYSNEGDAYIASFNANGADFETVYPKTYVHLEPSEDHEVVEKRARIYFGTNCDALHSEFGKGKWSGGNGAFGAEFGDHVISFNRQELDSMSFPNCYPPFK